MLYSMAQLMMLYGLAQLITLHSMAQLIIMLHNVAQLIMLHSMAQLVIMLYSMAELMIMLYGMAQLMIILHGISQLIITAYFYQVSSYCYRTKRSELIKHHWTPSYATSVHMVFPIISSKLVLMSHLSTNTLPTLITKFSKSW